MSREEVLAELGTRRKTYAENIASSETVSIPERLNPGGEEWVDYFGRLSSSRREAAKTTETQIVAREQSEEESAESGNAEAPQALALDRTRDLEAEIRGLSPALGFLDLEADSLVNSDIVSIRIKGPAEGSWGSASTANLSPTGRSASGSSTRPGCSGGRICRDPPRRRP